ncbi:MAG TPA: TonB-dependent receptor [Campylobacterales bacterium]|nr:TonB-dependent receptor [Campylobacterales bacterium]
MKPHVRLLTLSLMAVIPPFAHAQEVGTLSVFMLKDGKPLAKNEIVIDAKKHIYTDNDGSAKITLSVGQHQIEIFGKGINGKNLGYFKKPVTIKEDKDTQVVASFTMDEPEINIDTPVGELKNTHEKELKAKGTGTLNGRVITSDKGLPIVGARVFVKGTSIDARTDDNGRFSVQIPADSDVSISVVHSAYSAKTISQIQVEKDGAVSRQVELTPASLELEEFVVLAPKIEGSIADIMAEEKQTNAISNILGSEELSKKGDSDAASALKRVTGITLVGGKNIYVRGLGERYSNIELNGMPLPSPDPTKRVVPLDIFPASVIGSLKVQKSGSADIPSSFGGGYVNIRTKDKADEDYFKIGFGAKANSHTGTESITYEGGATDWLGFDDGYRDIPSAIRNYASVNIGERIRAFSRGDIADYEGITKDEAKVRLMELTEDFVQRDFAIKNQTLQPGGSISFEGLQNFEINDDHKITVFGNYGYGQEHTYREETFYKYRFDADGNQEDTPDSSGENVKASSTYTHDGMLNIGYNYLDLLKLKYTKLYTHIGEQNTRTTEGVFGSNYDYLLYHFLDWDERTINADQLTGEFDYQFWNTKNTFDFGLEYVTATLNQPNNFFYADKILDNGDKVILSGQTNFLAKRLESTDDVMAAFVNNKSEVNLFSDEDYVQVGASISSKERKSEYQKFYLANSGSTVDQYTIAGGDIEAMLDQYVRGDIEYDDRAFLVTSLFNPSDYFDAQVDESSFYTNVFAKPFEQLDITLGLRYVDLTQSIFQYQEDNSKNIERVEDSLNVSDIFPSVNIKYKYDKDNHFDVALSKTYIIPDLREFTDGSYFHPYDVATVRGNPDLVNTDIYSADMKYSHYFSDSESVKFGLFYKFLDKPIEDTQEESSSLPIYSFENSDSADLYGAEIDGRKNFDFISEKYSNYYVSGNFSYTNSDVTLTEDQKARLTSHDRQLQGLSKTVMNTTFGYEAEDRSLTLSYNKMGERIRKVGLLKSGTNVKYPDTIEVPPQLLDFVWTEKFDHDISAKLKVGNILDDETIWKQGSNTIKRFKKGQTFSVGISAKF